MVAVEVVEVEVARDHLQRLVRPTQPIAAAIELIWNALDADARNVRVSLLRNDADAVDGVRVSDDGTGIPASTCTRVFGKLGDSWKATAGATALEGRPLHGKTGQGRFRALALGQDAVWTTIADDVDGRYKVKIAMSASEPERVAISEPEATDEPTGTDILMTGSASSLNSLSSDEGQRRIAKEFARYLLRYKEITIEYDGWNVDPNRVINNFHRETLQLDQSDTEPPVLEIIEWSEQFPRDLVLCDETGFGLAEVRPGIQAAGFNFTAYLCWKGFDRSEVVLADSGHEVYGPVLELARDRMRAYFRQRSKDRIREVVDAWKTEQVYPFAGDPQDKVEAAKRDLFDVVAVQAIPGIPAERRAKRLSLRLIREAIEQSPTALQRVLRDVMDLSDEQIKELAELLDRTSFGALISAARLVADRLDFLRSLEFLLFDERINSEVLERTQLHRILAAEPWVFGDHFALAVDDKGIQEVLKKHLHYLDRTTLNLAHVEVEGKKTAIVDLMLSKVLEDSLRQHHLVVELKRPSVIIGHKEKQQIESYGCAVANDPQFREAEAKWDFVLVANDISPDVRRLARKKGLPPGCIHDDDELDLRIWIKHWGGIIDERRRSLHFIKDQIEINSTTDDGIALLQRKHAQFLPQLELGIPESGE